MTNLKEERMRYMYEKVNDMYVKELKNIKDICKELKISYGAYDKARKFVKKERGEETPKRQYNKVPPGEEKPKRVYPKRTKKETKLEETKIEETKLEEEKTELQTSN